MRKSSEHLGVLLQSPVPLQLAAHGLIDLLSATIVRRDDDGVLGLRSVVLGDGGDAVVYVWNLGDAALFRQQRNAFDRLVVRKMLDCFQ